MRTALPNDRRRRTAGDLAASLVVGLLLFGLLLFGLALPARAETHRLAVVASQNIGGAGTTPLRYADADAFKVGEVLVELCGFKREAVRVMPDVARAELLGALAEMARRSRTLSGGSGDQVLLVLFYSGHADREGLMLGRGRVSYEELHAAVELSGAQVQLQIIDACHAGSMTRKKGATAIPSFLTEVDGSLASKGRVVITSSAEDEYSQESDAIGSSYFTHFMVSGLRGAADENGDRRVTLDELYSYLYDETLFHTAGSRAGPQHPEYSFDLSGQGSIVLADLDTASASLVFPSDEGLYTVFDRRNRSFVGELESPPQAVRLAVAPGAYIVQRRGEEDLKSAEVELSNGDQVDVDGLAMVEQEFEDDIAKGLALRWKRRTRVLVRAGAGVHTVPQRALAEAYFPTMPLINVGVGVEWRGHPRTELLVDVAFGQARYQIPSSYYDIQTNETHVDAGVSYRFVEDLSGFRLAIGPRFAMLAYHRQPPGDSLAGFSVGVDGGIGLRFKQRVGVGLDFRAGYLLNNTALEDQSHVHLQALLRLDLAL